MTIAAALAGGFGCSDGHGGSSVVDASTDTRPPDRSQPDIMARDVSSNASRPEIVPFDMTPERDVRPPISRARAPARDACSEDRATTEAYGVSDAAHFDDSFFQEAHEATLRLARPPVAASLHQARVTSTDPTIAISDGTRRRAGSRALTTRLSQALAGYDVHADSCNRRDSNLQHCGTTNVQGRASNRAPNVCGSATVTASGLFLHLEQDKDRVLETLPALQMALEEVL